MRKFSKKVLQCGVVLATLVAMLYDCATAEEICNDVVHGIVEEQEIISEKQESVTISGSANVTAPDEKVAKADTEKVSVEIVKPTYIVETPYDKSIFVENGIEFHFVAGDTWQGVMAIVEDPSRCFVGMPRDAYNGQPGANATTIASRYGAVYAVNGAFFVDTDFCGNGGTPIGLVYSLGKNTFKTSNGAYLTMGWDNNNQFICGNLTAAQCNELGIRDALSCNPILVQNGAIGNLGTKSVSLLDARTAVGARADGAVLILTVDGRQSHSIGATTRDLAECMLSFGAVNAGNLDGGGSLSVYYAGTPLDGITSFYGHRKVPNAICVRPE